MTPHLAYAAAAHGREGMVVEELVVNEQDPPFAPFQASRFVVPVGAASDRERHPERECWLVASGRGLLDYQGVVVRITARDALHLDIDQPHRVVNDGDEPLVVFSIWWAP